MITTAPAEVWGVGLVIIGVLQALGSLALGLSITDPAALLLRTVFALAAGALLLVLATGLPWASLERRAAPIRRPLRSAERLDQTERLGPVAETSPDAWHVLADTSSPPARSRARGP